MSVIINIPPQLQLYTDGQPVVEVDGNTVGQCLGDLAKQFPGIKAGLFDNNGKLFDYLDVFVNLETSYPLKLVKPVKDGDELHITLFVIAGG